MMLYVISRDRPNTNYSVDRLCVCTVKNSSRGTVSARLKDCKVALS